MLIEFSVGNFLSIASEVTLTLEAGSIKERESENVFIKGGMRLLKGAAIYGANGSGKSNLIKAIRVLDRLVNESAKESQAGEPIQVEPFRLLSSFEKKPSMFEARFIVGDCEYRYGIQVTKTAVVEEWLYQREKGKRETELFSRDRQKIKVGRSFKEGSGLEGNTRENALFLSVCAQLNGAIAKKVVGAFKQLIIVTSTHDQMMWRITAALVSSDKVFREMLSKFLKLSDLGITDFVCSDTGKKVPELERMLAADKEIAGHSFAKAFVSEYNIGFKHPKKNKAGVNTGTEVFDLFLSESEGTRKLFGIGGVALIALQAGFTVIVDEFDARLHPIISKQLIHLFNDRRNSKAQLVIATHDTNLLSYGHYRRDQLWFVEKKSTGATDLYSLVEYRTDKDKKVRNDASFEKDYIQGRYGGIPYLGNFSELLQSFKNNGAS
jgi:AAA15 family ATPase/GTPase